MKASRIMLIISSSFPGTLLAALIALALSAFFFICPDLSNAQGAQQNLDTAFGVDGKVAFNTSKAFKLIRAIALQRNGKIVVVGDSNGKRGQQAFLGQLNKDGTLDTGFGISGFADVNFVYGGATAVTIQFDRRILVAGRAGVDFGLARFNKGGSPDLSFGSAGIVTTDFFGRLDQAWAITLQQDGKIIVAGSVGRGSIEEFDEQFALARYNADGSLDVTFGDRGKVIFDFFSPLNQALAVALQPDGKIVVGGLSSNDVTKNDFALARLTPDGMLDSSFGDGGRVTTDFRGGLDQVGEVIIQSDGRIVAVGEGDSKFALARYDTGGTLDSSFGDRGRVTTDFFGIAAAALAAAIQADGKIIAAGRASKINGDLGDDFALARYNTDGTLDVTFGINGKLTIDFFDNADAGTCLALQSDGKVIIAGGARHPSFKYSLAVARLQGQ